MAEDSGLREGDCFAVPLDTGGYGVGVAARVGKRGHVLGYFSPIRHKTLPALDEASFEPTAALWVHRFGDLGILEGTWPILGTVHNWNPADWPIPDFVHHDLLRDRSYRVSYDGVLDSRPTWTPATPESLQGLDEDGLAGSRFVELKLAKLFQSLIDESQRSGRTDGRVVVHPPD